jgi:hypothetical protein
LNVKCVVRSSRNDTYWDPTSRKHTNFPKLAIIVSSSLNTQETWSATKTEPTASETLKNEVSAFQTNYLRTSIPSERELDPGQTFSRSLLPKTGTSKSLWKSPLLNSGVTNNCLDYYEHWMTLLASNWLPKRVSNI